MRTRITLAFAAIVLLGAVGYGATVAIAQEGDGERHPFVQMLAEKLGLTEDEVEEALDEIKADKYAQLQQSKEDMLQSAVDDGVITEEQRQTLLDKYQEMWTEKKEEWQQHKDEMGAWFEQEGIDHEKLMDYMGGFGRKGFHKWGTGKTHTQ